MIGAEQDAGVFEGKGRMVGRMAGCVHGTDRPAVAIDDRIVGQGDVGHEIGVVAFVQRIDLADRQFARRTVRAFREHEGARCSLEAPGERGVVTMRVADENVAHRPSVDGVEQGLQMTLVVGTGIDDGKRIAPDNVAVGSVECEGRGVRRRDPQNVGCDAYERTVSRIETRVEF
jgi:hypothetical protein